MTQGQVPKTHPTAHGHPQDVNPGETPPPQALIRTSQGWTTPRGRGVCADTMQHGQPVCCLLARHWHCDVTMVPVRAAAASAGLALWLGLAVEGEAFVSVWVF